MFNRKRSGFTISELLMAMLIIGIIAILVLPVISRQINAKSRMALLKSTVSEVSSVVQKEMTQTGSGDITLTNLYNDPEKFLEEFDVTSTDDVFTAKYKTISGAESKDILIPSNNSKDQAAAKLKNGVEIGVMNKATAPPPSKKDQGQTQGGENNKLENMGLYGSTRSLIIVDVNGPEKPNTVGIDYFIFTVIWSDDPTTGAHAGETGGFVGGGIRPPRAPSEDEGDKGYIEVSKDELTTSCKKGNGAACFRLVELSGYKSDYLK